MQSIEYSIKKLNEQMLSQTPFKVYNIKLVPLQCLWADKSRWLFLPGGGITGNSRVTPFPQNIQKGNISEHRGGKRGWMELPIQTTLCVERQFDSDLAK